MYEINCAIGLTVLFFATLFPDELTDAVLRTELRVRLAWLNVQFFIAQWMIYRKLRREFLSYGIEVPPFEFKPLKLDEDA